MNSPLESSIPRPSKWLPRKVCREMGLKKEKSRNSFLEDSQADYVWLCNSLHFLSSLVNHLFTANPFVFCGVLSWKTLGEKKTCCRGFQHHCIFWKITPMGWLRVGWHPHLPNGMTWGHLNRLQAEAAVSAGEAALKAFRSAGGWDLGLVTYGCGMIWIGWLNVGTLWFDGFNEFSPIFHHLFFQCEKEQNTWLDTVP